MESELLNVEKPNNNGAVRSVRTSVRLLGPIEVLRDGTTVELPPSRKTKALLGIVATSPRPILRSWACDLLWDSVNDPRSELRWCLSKLRRVLGDDAKALVSNGEWLSLDQDAVAVDAVTFLRKASCLRRGERLAELQAADARYTGELLGDLQLGITQKFDNWLRDQREVVAAAHRAILKRIVDLLPLEAPRRTNVLRRLIDSAPFDDAAHGELLRSLLARRKLADAHEHLSATLSYYQQEEVDDTNLRNAWRLMRQRKPRHEQLQVRTPFNCEQLPEDAKESVEPRRPMVVIVPFAAAEPELTDTTRNLTHDVTIGLARLRGPFIVSESTAFVLGDRGHTSSEIGRSVAADYVVDGTVTRNGSKLSVDLNLIAARYGCLVWSGEIDIPNIDAHEAPNEIGSLITSALATEIELTECHRALTKSVTSLTAWEAHHRGLWHLHRFTKTDNEMAVGFFDRANALDPSLSRSYAGRSYAHWMNAFAFRPADKDAELRLALDAACRALHADPKDPAALWAMSRAQWMSNEEQAAVRTIDQAIDLSPSFALARHSRSFCECQTGDPVCAIRDSQLAEKLSPFDPWRYAMFGVQAFANLRLGNLGKATDAAQRLTSMPNAHLQARGLAALVLAACGEIDHARREIAVVRRLRHSYRMRDFFSAYHVTGHLRARLVDAGLRAGLQY